MIITANEVNDIYKTKVKYFNDNTYLISLINTEENLGVVCYLYDNIWKPFNISAHSKAKLKGKTCREIINSAPTVNRDNIANIKGKFYNTFDTPIEVDNNPIVAIYDLTNDTLARNTYYLITDVQELERTFNSNIIPCKIINFNNINDLINDRKVDECLQYLVNTYLTK